MASHAAQRAGLLAVIGLAFAARAIGSQTQSLWRDEVDTLRFATRALPELLGQFAQAGQNGPLYFLAMRPWLAVAGPGEFALRFPSAAAGALSVAAIYVLVRRLAGTAEALIAALLAATAPYLVWYAQEAKMYAALTVLVPLSLWCVLEATGRGGWVRWGALYLVTTAALYTHILAALVIPVQAAWILLWPTAQIPARRLARAAGYLAVLLLPYLPLLRWQAPYLFAAASEAGRSPESPGRLAALLAVAATHGVTPDPALWRLVPGLLAALAGVILWRGGAGRRVPVLLLLWLALPVILAVPVSVGLPVLAERYLIWTLPALLALVALGVVALAQRARWLGGGLLGLIVALNVVGIAAQATGPLKSDFRQAVAFVRATAQPGDVLLFQIPHARYAFSYYDAEGSPASTAGCLPVAELWFTGECGNEPYAPLPHIDGLYVAPGEDAEAFGRRMAASVDGLSAVWLVASEAEMWDPPGYTGAWLASHGSVTDHADFTRVSVTRYNLTS